MRIACERQTLQIISIECTKVCRVLDSVCVCVCMSCYFQVANKFLRKRIIISDDSLINIARAVFNVFRLRKCGAQLLRCAETSVFQFVDSQLLLLQNHSFTTLGSAIDVSWHWKNTGAVSHNRHFFQLPKFVFFRFFFYIFVRSAFSPWISVASRLYLCRRHM